MINNTEVLKFLSKFSFKPELANYVGIEREHFLRSVSNGLLTPMSMEFLKTIKNKAWTYELSACQVESRTKPKKDQSSINLELLANENRGSAIANKLGVELLNTEVGPEDMVLDVYPNPRYLRIVKSISMERLRAACRVAGTHIHIGVRDIGHAIRLNNALVAHLDKLCAVGDHSCGERLRLYNIVTQNCQVSTYDSIEHLFEVSREEGFTENPRDCWKMIRISIHGTVELRMFGATEKIDEIMYWISLIKQVAKEVA